MNVIRYLREYQMTLTRDASTGTLRHDLGDNAKTITMKANYR
jgi:hypothetical protein